MAKVPEETDLIVRKYHAQNLIAYVVIMIFFAAASAIVVGTVVGTALSTNTSDHTALLLWVVAAGLYMFVTLASTTHLFIVPWLANFMPGPNTPESRALKKYTNTEQE